MSDVVGAVRYDRETGVVSGWLYDPSDLSRAHRVEIAIDGVLTAALSANLLVWGADRPSDAMYNAFEYLVPSNYRSDARLHTVEVRSGDGVELAGSPFLVENVSDLKGLKPQFRIVDRNPTVSRQARPAGAPGDWVQLLPAEPFVRPAGSMDSREHNIGNLWGHQSYQPHRQYIAYLADVYVDPLNGNVFNRAGELWSACQYLRNTDAIRDARKLIAEAPDQIPHVDGDTLIYSETVLGNYAHWHSDCLPSLVLAQKTLTGPYTVLSPPMNRWQRQSAELILGGPAQSTESLLVHVDGVYCTGYMDGRSIYPDAGVMETYDRLRVAAGLPAPSLAMADERIFISRKDAAGVRLLENEDELFAALEPYGFKSHLLAQLPYTEQIRLFTRANAVVGNHGAGLTNLAFCPPGAIAFEIIRAGGLVGTLRYLAVRTGLSHHWYSVSDEEAVRLDVPAFMAFFKQHFPA